MGWGWGQQQSCPGTSHSKPQDWRHMFEGLGKPTGIRVAEMRTERTGQVKTIYQAARGREQEADSVLSGLTNPQDQGPQSGRRMAALQTSLKFSCPILPSLSSAFLTLPAPKHPRPYLFCFREHFSLFEWPPVSGVPGIPSHFSIKRRKVSPLYESNNKSATQ